jgi:predicted pyridoxine 5'-phosphate oxidase superfamily flavin-nucleotide-binding protein
MKNSVLCWLATVDPAGVPNVTPKEIFTSHGEDRIVIADIASSNSVRNIRSQPNVCVSFIDIRQRGFKIVGKATIIPPEAEEFPTLGAELLRMAGEDFLIRNIIAVGIDRISRIWAPSYTLFPDQTDEERMQIAYDAYRARPAS